MEAREEKHTQKSVILAHLMRFGSIESLTALREYGVYILGARIADLRSEGHNIETKTMNSVSRITGRHVHFTNYKLRV